MWRYLNLIDQNQAEFSFNTNNQQFLTEQNKSRREKYNLRVQMKIEVKFFTSLREITGKKIDEIESQNSITVDELLTFLSDKYGKKFMEYIYDESGQIREFLSFLVSGKNINKLQGFDTKLQNGDVLAILPPVGGG